VEELGGAGAIERPGVRDSGHGGRYIKKS
jgi:hypothetical protein